MLQHDVAVSDKALVITIINSPEVMSSTSDNSKLLERSLLLMELVDNDHLLHFYALTEHKISNISTTVRGV